MRTNRTGGRRGMFGYLERSLCPTRLAFHSMNCALQKNFKWETTILGGPHSARY